MAEIEIAERWAEIGGVRTRYLEAGAGDPIVFLHGGYAGDPAMADSADAWDTVLPTLAGRYRCLALDRLGQGATGNPKSDAEYAMSASVAHAIGFLRAFGDEAFHLVGHASGAYVAVEVTLQAPERVRSCTILSADLIAPGAGRTEFALAGNPFAPFSADSARFVIEKSSFRRDHVTTAWLDRIEFILASAKYRDAGAKMMAAGLYDTVYLPRLRGDRDRMSGRLALGSIGRPVMLFWGSHDPIAPLPYAYDTFDVLARHELRCELHLVNEAGRYAFREKPEAFHRILTNFLENVRHGA